MSFICKDKAYSSNVWSVMLDASLIYKCVQYLLNSLYLKAVYCFEFIWNVCSRHFDSEYLPYRCTVPLALGHRPPFRASVPLTRDWPPQSTTQWPSPMTTSLSLARSQSGKILRWDINQQMIHSNTFGYGFKRVNYMQKTKQIQHWIVQQTTTLFGLKQTLLNLKNIFVLVLKKWVKADCKQICQEKTMQISVTVLAHNK